MVHRK